MGVYSSSFVVNPQSSSAVCSYSHPSKANWITAHAIATELSIAEVERLWMRFQQMGCNRDGALTPDMINSQALSADVFMKNIMKYFKNQDGSMIFETFLRALKWCEMQELREKARAIFQMLNNGNPIPKDLFGKIMSRVYPNDRAEEVKRVTESFFKIVDKRKRGQLEENDFVQAVMNLPREPVNSILNFHILPEAMRENVHRNLPEFSSQQANPSGRAGGGFTPIYSPGPSHMDSQIPSDGILREISDKIYRKDWDLLANSLGFLSEDVENYRLQNPSSGSQQSPGKKCYGSVEFTKPKYKLLLKCFLLFLLLGLALGGLVHNNYYRLLIQPVFEMLKDWRTREGKQATSITLERALRDNGMTDASLLLAP